MVFVVKTVPREPSSHFIGQRNKKSRNHIEKEIHELIIRHNDQNVGFRCLEIRAQNRKGFFRILPQFLLLLESWFRRPTTRRYVVMYFDKILPHRAGFEKNVWSVT